MGRTKKIQAVLYWNPGQAIHQRERKIAKINLRTQPFNSYFTTLRAANGLQCIFSNVAGWQSGYAAACKAVYAGSIPASASMLNKA